MAIYNDEDHRQQAHVFGFLDGRAYAERYFRVREMIGEIRTTPTDWQRQRLTDRIAAWWKHALECGSRYKALQALICSDRTSLTYSDAHLDGLIASLLPPWPDGWATDEDITAR